MVIFFKKNVINKELCTLHKSYFSLHNTYLCTDFLLLNNYTNDTFQFSGTCR